MKVTDVMRKKAQETKLGPDIFDDKPVQEIVECTIDPTAYEEISEPQEPKLRITKEQYEALLADKDRRQTIGSYYKYVLHCRPDLKETKLHKVLANTIQEFLERHKKKEYIKLSGIQ